MSKPKQTTLACFSPAVMLITLIIEFGAALYVLVTGFKQPSARVIIALLICLGFFQLAEYQICGGANNVLWMRAGYVSIALLPPLGIHLISLVVKRAWVRNAAYALAFVFIAAFLINAQTIQDAVCAGNYILINTGGVVASEYFPLYYNILLAVAVWEIISYVSGRFAVGKKKPVAKEMLYWLLGGYASFIVPAGTIYLLAPDTRLAFPSIMCGFAVFLALILTIKVYPLCRKLNI